MPSHSRLSGILLNWHSSTPHCHVSLSPVIVVHAAHYCFGTPGIGAFLLRVDPQRAVRFYPSGRLRLSYDIDQRIVAHDRYLITPSPKPCSYAAVSVGRYMACCCAVPPISILSMRLRRMRCRFGVLWLCTLSWPGPVVNVQCCDWLLVAFGSPGSIDAAVS